jgi:hypothetical protein
MTFYPTLTGPSDSIKSPSYVTQLICERHVYESLLENYKVYDEMAKNFNTKSAEIYAKRAIKVEVAEKSHCIRFNDFIV